MAVAQTLVEPRWGISASLCIMDSNTTEGIHFQGSD